MSNFTTSYINNVDNTISNKYFKGIEIYSSSIETKIASNGSYYSFQYDNGSDPNLSCSILTPTTYTANNFYLYGLLHNNITGKTDSTSNTVIPPNPPNLPSYIGELVIEHTNSNSLNKVYVCYLLQNNTSKTTSYSNDTNVPNSFDDIISFISDKNNKNTPLISGLNLSTFLPSMTPNNSKYIYYIDTNNANNIVIVFLDPIPITNIDNAKFIYNLSTTSNLFSINAPLQPTPITPNPNSASTNSSSNSNNPNPNDNNDIYIDCAPTGVSETEIQTYNLPISSDLIGNIKQMDFIKLSINFLVFLFVAVIVFFTVPTMYKKTVIDYSNKIWSNTKKPDNPLIRIRSIDIWITFFVFITCASALSDGFDNNNSISLIIGLFIAIIFGLSVSLVQYNKNEKNFMTTVLENKDCGGSGKIGELYGQGEDSFKFTRLADLLDTFKEGVLFYFQQVLKVHIALIFFILGIACFIYYLVMNKRFDTNGFGKLASMIIYILFPISFILKLLM